jgi:hypothetical protein
MASSICATSPSVLLTYSSQPTLRAPAASAARRRARFISATMSVRNRRRGSSDAKPYLGRTRPSSFSIEPSPSGGRKRIVPPWWTAAHETDDAPHGVLHDEARHVRIELRPRRGRPVARLAVQREQLVAPLGECRGSHVESKMSRDGCTMPAADQHCKRHEPLAHRDPGRCGHANDEVRRQPLEALPSAVDRLHPARSGRDDAPQHQAVARLDLSADQRAVEVDRGREPAQLVVRQGPRLVEEESVQAVRRSAGRRKARGVRNDQAEANRALLLPRRLAW